MTGIARKCEETAGALANIHNALGRFRSPSYRAPQIQRLDAGRRCRSSEAQWRAREWKPYNLK